MAASEMMEKEGRALNGLVHKVIELKQIHRRVCGASSSSQHVDNSFLGFKGR
jgi:hypothetical protein